MALENWMRKTLTWCATRRLPRNPEDDHTLRFDEAAPTKRAIDVLGWRSSAGVIERKNLLDRLMELGSPGSSSDRRRKPDPTYAVVLTCLPPICRQQFRLLVMSCQNQHAACPRKDRRILAGAPTCVKRRTVAHLPLDFRVAADAEIAGHAAGRERIRRSRGPPPAALLLGCRWLAGCAADVERSDDASTPTSGQKR